MVKLQRHSATLVAETLRQEINGKMSVLGFFGVSPLVSIYLPEIPCLTNLSLLFICESTPEAGEISVEMQLEWEDGTVLLARQQIDGQRSEGNKPALSTMVGVSMMALPISTEGKLLAKLWTLDRFHSESSVSFRGEFL